MIIVRETHALDRDDYRQYMRIDEDGVKLVEFCDGEHEDNTLSRNFNDCVRLHDLFQKFYEYGLAGKQVTFTSEEVDWEDI